MKAQKEEPLKNQEPERFVTLESLQISMKNAAAIVQAFDKASKAISGGQIHLYERGFGPSEDRTLRASSTYTKAGQTLDIASVTAAFCYGTYAAIINKDNFPILDRDEMIKECHSTLKKADEYAESVPSVVYSDCTPTSLRTCTNKR